MGYGIYWKVSATDRFLFLRLHRLIPLSLAALWMRTILQKKKNSLDSYDKGCCAF